MLSPEKASKVSQLIEFYQKTETNSVPTPKKPIRKILAIEPGLSPETTLAKDTSSLQEPDKADVCDLNGDTTAAPSSISTLRTCMSLSSTTSTSSSCDHTITLPITITLPPKAYENDYRVEAIGFTRVFLYSDDAPAAGLEDIISHPYAPFCIQQTSRTLSRSTSPQTSSRMTPDSSRHLFNKTMSDQQPRQPAPEEQMNHETHSEYGVVSPVGWASFKDDSSGTQFSHSISSHTTSEARNELPAKDRTPEFTQLAMAQRNLQNRAKALQSAQLAADGVIGPNWVLGEELQKAPIMPKNICPDAPMNRCNSLDILQGVSLKEKLRRVGRKFKGSGTNSKSTWQD